MSRTISISRFLLTYVLYVLASLTVYFTTSFTIPTWIAYLFILLPFYGCVLLYTLALTWKHQRSRIRYKLQPLYLSILFQVLMVLASPSSCYGWKQGKACYSLIQALFVTNLRSSPPHWSFIESFFPVALILHIIFVVIFLIKASVQKS
jgi:hypothetical protein